MARNVHMTIANNLPNYIAQLEQLSELLLKAEELVGDIVQHPLADEDNIEEIEAGIQKTVFEIQTALDNRKGTDR